ncbi:DNA dC-_dU-editing enzyme APOBEC-3G-like isoform X3 [Myotis lucifugus]|uniref:DNA dC->dU-editing enzyme APOBEC-3G-like isoform X3 n=1 Tax=Myotis lucifugus TaxID=59463 RepID=UPI0006D7384A|nr:DNA dC->dU-editing enzyme APOBEC-3G-like isoform X3 [Myotis lucifugus]
MENNPAPTGRTLINKATFRRNFRNKCENQTYLCYEVEVWKDGKWTKVEELQGFLRNQGADTHREPGHAELCFLDRVRSWHLDEGRQYRLTCYISWTPGPDCAQKLVEFLGENRHVSLRIFAAGIHTKYRGHEDGLRQLWDAGAQIAIMTLNELQHCWETFVDNQGQPFEPWPIQVEHIQTESQKLKDILRSGVFW